MDCATVSVLAATARWTPPPSGFEVAASTNTPRPFSAATSEQRLQGTEAEVRRSRSLASAANRTVPPPRPCAYAAMVQPMSPRLASAMTSTPADCRGRRWCAPAQRSRPSRRPRRRQPVASCGREPFHRLRTQTIAEPGQTVRGDQAGPRTAAVPGGGRYPRTAVHAWPLRMPAVHRSPSRSPPHPLAKSLLGFITQRGVQLRQRPHIDLTTDSGLDTLHRRRGTLHCRDAGDVHRPQQLTGSRSRRCVGPSCRMAC